MQQKNPQLIDIGKRLESLTNSVNQRAVGIYPSETQSNDPKHQPHQPGMSSSAIPPQNRLDAVFVLIAKFHP
jgi:hypothetical protein